jgi:type I restriction enzyme S subunit
MTEPSVALPPASIQEDFRKTIEPIRSSMTSLVEATATLSRIRDLLLPKLVTGQIDVSSLDLDRLVEEVAE